MLELLHTLFSSQPFMPHGMCYLWTPSLVRLEVATNLSIGFAYAAIPITLLYLVRVGRYVPFKGMALAFGAFIVTCGLTHFFDVLVIWKPVYWLDVAVRGITAVASVATAIMLPFLVPRAVALARSAQAARERGVKLEVALAGVETMVERGRSSSISRPSSSRV